MNIYLDNNIIDTVRLTDAEMGVYVALKGIYQASKNRQYISYNMLAFELYGNGKYKRSICDAIKDAFNSLVQKKYISIIETLSTTEFVVDMSGLYINMEKSNTYYTTISDTELHSIMNIGGRSDKFKLLRYFLICLKTICKSQDVYKDNYNARINFVGFMSQEYLSQHTGIDISQIIEYNRILEENHLLYIYRHKEMKRNTITGQFKSFTNHYGRYEDREDIITFAKNYEKVHGIEEQLVQSEKSNRKRSISAKYNNLCKDFDRYINQYSNDELIEIYKQIRHDNEQIQSDLIGAKVGSDYYEKLRLKLRDEEIFDKIPCIVQYRSRNIIKLNCENEDNWGEPDHIA